MDICRTDWFYGNTFCSNLLLYCNFTYFPILVHLRDVDGHVLAVLPVTETLRHACHQTPVVNAAQSARDVFPGDWTEWPLRYSDHHRHVGVVAHEPVSGDSNCERSLQLVWDVSLDDESLEPATVLGLRNPHTGERRELVHIRRRLISSTLTGGSRKG